MVTMQPEMSSKFDGDEDVNERMLFRSVNTWILYANKMSFDVGYDLFLHKPPLGFIG